MVDIMITDGIKQTVITRSACLNTAISMSGLINGRPANVTEAELFGLAERIERWIWRGLVGERRTNVQEAEKTAAPPAPPANTSPEPPRLDPPPRQREPQLNGDGQRAGEASEKQINAIFAIGRSKGFNSNDLKAEIKEKLGKSVMQLTRSEASQLIDDLRAM